MMPLQLPSSVVMASPAVTPSPSPVPVEVLVRSGPAEWWQLASAWTPFFVLLGAVLAAVVGWRTLRQRTVADALALEQKRVADGRAEWWRRTQWALDHALDKDPSTRALGLVALGTLAASELAPVEELEMLESMTRIVHTSTPVPDPGDDQAPPPSPDEGNAAPR